MQQLNKEQKEVLEAFNDLDAYIGELVLSVKQGSGLAQRFGRCARAVDICLQVQTGIDPEARFEDKPKLEAVEDDGRSEVVIDKPEPSIQ